MRILVYAQLTNGLDHELIEYAINVFDEIIKYDTKALPIVRAIVGILGKSYPVHDVAESIIAIHSFSYKSHLIDLKDTDDPEAGAMNLIVNEIVDHFKNKVK